MWQYVHLKTIIGRIPFTNMNKMKFPMTFPALQKSVIKIHRPTWQGRIKQARGPWHNWSAGPLWILRSTTNQPFWISTDHYDRVCSWEVDGSQMIITYVCNIVYMIITLSNLIANKSIPKILRSDDACSRVPDVVWRPCIIKARSYCLCHEKIGLPMTLNQPSFWIHKKISAFLHLPYKQKF